MESDKIEYLVDKVLEKVLSIKKALDRLVFTLLLLSILGLSMSNKSNLDEPIKILGIPIPAENFSLVISVFLLGTFAMIGLHLIDYIRKRDLLDKYVSDRYREVDKEEMLDILIPASFYEFMYELDERTDQLRWPASAIFVFIFYFSHYVALFHLGKVSMPPYLDLFVFIIFVGVYVACYTVYITSIPTGKEKLRSVILKIIGGTFIGSVILALAIDYFL